MQQRSVLCIACLVVSQSCLSATATETKNYPVLEELVVVASRVATPHNQIAATVTTIDAREIEAVAASSLRDVLGAHPGVTLRRDPTRFGDDSIGIRGIGGNRVAMLIDGVPVAKGFTVGNYSHAGRPLPEVDNIERVEILRGPASALYGSDAIGGVVSIATLTPRSLLQDDSTAMQIRSGYRADTDEVRGGLDLAIDYDPWQALLSLTRREAGEIDTTGHLPSNPRTARYDIGGGQLSWKDAPGGRLRILTSVQRGTVQTDINSLVLSPGRFANTTALHGHDTIRIDRISIDQNLGFQKLTGEWRAYWSKTAFNQDSDEDRRAVAPATPPQHFDRVFQMRSAITGVELTVSNTWAGETLSQRFVYGLSISRATVSELRNGQRVTLTTGAVSNEVLGELLPVRDFPPSELIEAGAYVQDDLRIGQRWSIIPGVRIDYYELLPKPDAIYIEDNGNTAVSIRHIAASPKLGLLYRASKAAVLFAQYAHGFRAPPMEDVNIGLRIPTQSVRAIPNPELVPERSHSFEIGTRIEHHGLRAALSVFHTEYRNFIESKRNIGRDPADPATTLFQSQNIAHARIYGVEADALWQLESLANELQGFSIALSASWTRGRDNVRHVSLNSVDPAEAVVKVSYASPTHTWSLDAIGRRADSKDDVYTPPTATVPFATVTGYTTLDTFFHWRFDTQIKLDVGVINLLNQRYQVWADVRERPNNDPQLPLFYQPGRGVVASLKWRW